MSLNASIKITPKLPHTLSSRVLHKVLLRPFSLKQFVRALHYTRIVKMPSKDKYTDPELREQVKEELKEGDKGGAPGQWSARKVLLQSSISILRADYCC